jgi:hypothetical protein
MTEMENSMPYIRVSVVNLDKNYSNLIGDINYNRAAKKGRQFCDVISDIWS